MLTTNILYSAILKIISLSTSLLIVPIIIGYLNNEVYGIWMTITSILFWIGTTVSPIVLMLIDAFEESLIANVQLRRAFHYRQSLGSRSSASRPTVVGRSAHARGTPFIFKFDAL